MCHNRLSVIRILSLLFLLSVRIASSATIERSDEGGRVVSLSGIEEKTWKVQDGVCLYRDNALLGCGVVDSVVVKGLLVRLDSIKGFAEVGTTVVVRKHLKGSTTTAAVAGKFHAKGNSKTADLLLGITAGPTYYYPIFQFQVALSRDFSIGVMPLYANYGQGGDTILAYGGYLTATYYYTHFVFKGVFVEAGAGVYRIIGESEVGNLREESTPFAGKLTAGWRGKALWEIGLDLGVAGGFQYVSYDSPTLDLSFRGFLPLIAAFVGYSF